MYARGLLSSEWCPRAARFSCERASEPHQGSKNRPHLGCANRSGSGLHCVHFTKPFCCFWIFLSRFEHPMSIFDHPANSGWPPENRLNGWRRLRYPRRARFWQASDTSVFFPPRCKRNASWSLFNGTSSRADGHAGSAWAFPLKAKRGTELATRSWLSAQGRNMSFPERPGVCAALLAAPP